MCRARSLIAVLAVLAVLAAGQMPLLLRCYHLNCQHLDYTAYEVDGVNIDILLHESYLTIDCHGANVLESAAMPRAVSGRVSYVELRSCPLPARSLAETLAAINVTFECVSSAAVEIKRELTINNLPPTPPLAASHFAGLSCLDRLLMYGENEQARPRPEHGFLAPLLGLHSLSMWNVELPIDELPVPPSLTSIDLDVASLAQLPVVSTLDYLRLAGWSESNPTPLVDCSALRELNLHKPAASALPDGWLGNCSRLTLLRITQAYELKTLPPNLFLGNTNLKDLTISQSALETLPAGLLDYLPNLRTLRLTESYLKTLPSGMFATAREVQNLDLSYNELSGNVMEELKPLEELTELKLGHNLHLGDFCKEGGYSQIHNSVKLSKLLLTETNVSHICRDWRHNMTALKTLDLSRTGLTKLTFEELQFTRIVKAAEVVLTGAPIAVVRMTRVEFNDAHDLSDAVSVRMNAKLHCDCRMYWMRRALNLPLTGLRRVVGDLTCVGGRKLRQVPSEELVCPRQKECAGLPGACVCTARSDHDSRHDRLLVRVRCEHAALTRVPRPQPHDSATDRVYELLLQQNNVTELQTDDLHLIQSLDLRNNSLKHVDEATAAKLGGLRGMLRLAGNPLDCSCRAAPLLRALGARDPSFTDRQEATCANGIALYAAPSEDCFSGLSLTAGLAVMLAVLLVVVLVSAILFASRSRRFFARAVLHRWGVGWRSPEPATEAARRYDAFLTFAHKDEGVVCEVMARLEPRYRLCVHQRDWVPGLSIVEQVVESVRESRRTVAFVSRHFLASAWTRVEFREAHALAMVEARPRLVVVLLEEPGALPMDSALRRYVATHTYVRWGDPWFWDKLAVALPKPCAPPPAHLEPLLPLHDLTKVQRTKAVNSEAQS